MKRPLVVFGLALATLLAEPTAAQPVYGDSQSALRKPLSDGGLPVDTPALIKRLQELNATTYAYSLCSQVSDYPNLVEEFLPAADQAGIEVWAYLVPPSEIGNCKDLVPCGQDYVCWAQHLGELAATHPSLTTILMDDFGYNLETFTPAYVKEMMDAAHSFAPSLRFFAIEYFERVFKDFLGTDYRGVVDGIVFAYKDILGTEMLPNQLDQLQLAATGRADLRFHTPPNTPSKAGDYIELRRTLAVTGPASLSFDRLDTCETDAGGYRVFQIFADDVEINKYEVEGLEANPHCYCDLSAATAGKTQVDLRLRLLDVKGVYNFSFDLFLYNLQMKGLDTDSGSWEVLRQGAEKSTASATSFQNNYQTYLMVYTRNVSFSDATPSNAYIASALTIGHDKMAAGTLDGLVTYGLHKEPELPEPFNTVSGLYATWRAEGDAGSETQSDSGPEAAVGVEGSVEGGATADSATIDSSVVPDSSVTPGNGSAACPQDESCACRLDPTGTSRAPVLPTGSLLVLLTCLRRRAAHRRFARIHAKR